MTSFDERITAGLSFLADYPYLQALAVALGALVVAKIADWVVAGVLARWAKRSRTDLDDRLLRLLHRPIFLSVLAVGFYLAIRRLGLPDGVELFFLRVFKTLAILVWLLFGIRASVVVLEALARVQHRLELVNDRTLALMHNLSKIVLVGGAIYAGFLSWGIDVGGLLVSAGVLGIALGFAAKDTLANFFSGFFILTDAPYKVGDWVNLDAGERGQITHIGLRSTRLLTRDDVEITMPNAVIGNAKIINETGGPWERERVRIAVGVAYGSDVDLVRRVLEEIARDEPLLAEDPAPRVRFRAFGDSSLDFELLGWIDEPVLRGRTIDALNTAVYKRFSSERIQIPFPQRVVHLHRPGPEPGPATPEPESPTPESKEPESKAPESKAPESPAPRSPAPRSPATE